MELDDLIIAWKRQNEKPDQHLPKEMIRFLLKQKSQGALSKIRRHLTKELILIASVFVLCNVLFVLIDLPYNTIRCTSLTIFDLIVFWYLYYYFKAIYSLFTLSYNDDLRKNINRLIENLNHFCNKYKLLNLPVIFLCIVMFAGSQNLFVLIPWMAIEFLLWRWVLLPKLVARFEVYKSDLEYSLRNLQELKD